MERATAALCVVLGPIEHIAAVEAIGGKTGKDKDFLTP